ncbi:DUF6493 family protein [Nonomuraea sp. NPDC049725]|uniref:DUF7824 domain-containing protein n=1 Tax=Nonomuraea sp. NPDC049725 TaxID=3154508 RepID=UPI00343321C4
MTVWTEIRDLITRNDVTRLADRLAALTEEERAEPAGRLPGLVKELRAARTERLRARHSGDLEEMISWEVGDMLDRLAGALLLAGVGLITGPAAAVAWMTSRDVNRRWADALDVAGVCRLAACRPAPWRSEVAVRLAQRIRRPADRIAPLAVALLRDSGAAPPGHDPLVAAWLTAPGVTGDPLTPALLPRIFTAEGAGRALREERLEPRPTRWLAAAARELPRDQALDGCVSRFLRGGDGQDLRFFVRLHTLLDPTPAETAPRLRDYLRLLPSAPGTVAELAVAQVRRAMPLDRADLAEAVDALTFRAEAKLATTGLRWLDQALLAEPESAAGFVTALTTAYAHASFDVRNRAAELTLKHAGLFAAHAETILDAVRHLPADLSADLAVRVVERFGGEIPAEEPQARKEFPPLPEPPEARPFPEPSIFPGRHEGWIDEERWLAAFVAGAAADRAKLRRELQPHVVRHQGHWRSKDVRLNPGDWRWVLSAELVSPGSVPEPPPIGPEKYWDSAGFSVEVRVLTRGEEPEPEPPSMRMSMGIYRPGRHLADDAPPRVFTITWTSDDGPGKAVAHEDGRPIPFADGRVRLNDPPTRVGEESFEGPSGRSRSVRGRPGVLYDDSGEAMPSFVLDDAYERMAELGVDPARIAAMRAGEQVPPPGPDEPLVGVSVEFFPPRLRSVMPPELSEEEEWRRRNRLPYGRVSPFHEFLLHRYVEVAEALRDDALPPVLLATPTWMNGHLDPDVLVDRLETCAAAGVEPLPADLAQALLRLPRGSHPAAAERAAKAGSEAARSAARWLAGDGLADPACGHVWRHLAGASMVEFGDGEPRHFTEVRLRPVLRVTAPTGHRLIDEVLLRPPDDRSVDESSGTLRGWPAMLPSHREIVAVNLLPFLLRDRWSRRITPEEVTGLELADGPAGESTAVILAFLLAEGVPGLIPSILRMAARGVLPAEAIGRQLALVLRRTWQETRPAIAALTELAEAGGHHEVWRILTTLLPGMLPGGGRTSVTHAELVAFAADVARWTGARGEIPVVGAYARSRRTTRIVHECRRLHAQLTGATPGL